MCSWDTRKSRKLTLALENPVHSLWCVDISIYRAPAGISQYDPGAYAPRTMVRFYSIHVLGSPSRVGHLWILLSFCCGFYLTHLVFWNGINSRGVQPKVATPGSWHLLVSPGRVTCQVRVVRFYVSCLLLSSSSSSTATLDQCSLPDLNRASIHKNILIKWGANPTWGPAKGLLDRFVIVSVRRLESFGDWAWLSTSQFSAKIGISWQWGLFKKDINLKFCWVRQVCFSLCGNYVSVLLVFPLFVWWYVLYYLCFLELIFGNTSTSTKTKWSV